MNSSHTIYTIGHSTHSIDQFVATLREYRIELVADVRRFPVSRRFPHFTSDRIAQSLAGAGIGYEHFVDLGGRRTPKPDSRNTGLRNPQFRGYADYMEMDKFRNAVARLLGLIPLKPIALMCAEALPWRCHRSLLADYLKSTGLKVIHIFSSTKTEDHSYTRAAQIVDGTLKYGNAQEELGL